jgi:hypothetical protein
MGKDQQYYKIKLIIKLLNFTNLTLEYIIVNLYIITISFKAPKRKLLFFLNKLTNQKGKKYIHLNLF